MCISDWSSDVFSSDLLEDDVITEHRFHRGRTLAAAVGPHADIGREQRPERAHVAAARGGKKGVGDFEPAFLLELVARTRVADMGAGARGELARRGGVAVDRLRDLIEPDPHDSDDTAIGRDSGRERVRPYG